MRVLILLLALVGAALAVPGKIQRIVGGSPTTVEEHPYMANMKYCYFSVTACFHNCGGTLITTRSVLSAAHCYWGDVASDWRAALGTSCDETGGTLYHVSSITFHEDYNVAAIDNDLVILKLATPAVLSDSVRVARIAGPNYNLPDGTILTTAGWGALQFHGAPPHQLHHVDVNQINQEVCVERYGQLQSTPNVTDGMICIGVLDVGGKDACSGDSGGPTIHAGDVLVGVTSWSYLCAHHTYPGVNVRVSYYTDWILANA